MVALNGWLVAVKTKRLREELVGAAGAREQAIEMKEKADALGQRAEEQARGREKAEAEVNQNNTPRGTFSWAVRLLPALLVLAVVGASESEPWGCSSSTTAIQEREVEGRGRTSRRVGARQQQ